MLLINMPHGGGTGPSSPLSQMFFSDDSKSFGSSDGSDEENGKQCYSFSPKIVMDS